MRFQYDLDGRVLVESGGALYIDTKANFEIDSGAPLLAPVGFYFAPGKINKISNGQDDAAGVANIAPYTAHIGNVAALLAAKAAREAVAATAAATAAAAAKAAFDATQAGINAKARAVLLALDLSSIRSLREYVAAKNDAPQFLKDKETAAALERAKIV